MNRSPRPVAKALHKGISWRRRESNPRTVPPALASSRATLARFTTRADDPTLALFAAQAAGASDDELARLAEPLIGTQTVSGDEVDEVAARKPRVDVLDSHASVSNTPAEVLVHPPPLKAAEER